MSNLKELLDVMASNGNDWEQSQPIVLIRTASEFDKTCDSLAKLIVSWKEGSLPVTNEQCEEAMGIIGTLREKYGDLSSKTSALSEQIVMIQSQLATERRERQSSERDLQTKIDELQSSKRDLQTKVDKLMIMSAERDEERRVMLIRALGTSFQYALTQKFPGVFTTKYPYSCTFNDIDRKIAAQHNASYDAILESVKTFFSERGIEPSDINALIKTIRELGTATGHVTEAIDANGVTYKPCAADLHQVINVANLSEAVKADARILLDALASIVPTGGDLLYRA